MISVLKRDGTVEAFDGLKLRGCLLRVMPSGNADLYFAEAVSEGVECYLRRNGIRCVSSAAILEMVLTVLAATGMTAPGASLESRHIARLCLRRRLRVHHDAETRTAWSKDWLVQQGRSQWGLGRAAARILAGEVEQGLVHDRARDVSRSAVMGMLARRAAGYGILPEGRPAALAGEG